MKKLLVLMLVLGMASLASAGLLLSASGGPELGQGEVVTITLGSDVGVPPGGGLITYVHITAGDGGLSNPGMTAGTTASMLSSNKTYTDETTAGLGDGYRAVAATLFSPLEAGDWFTWDFTMGAEETTITFFDDTGAGGWAGEAVGSLTFIPEPMSLMLLGLGGLFLRRRK